MEARLHSWWQKIRQRRVAIAVTTTILVVAIALIIIGYWFDATGFNEYTQVSTIHTLSGPTAGTVTRTEVYQPGKTLWDWMQLLFIPVVLAVAGFWFNHRERKAAELRTENERKAAELHAAAERDIEQQRAKAVREISTDNQHEAALKEYIDKLSDLLLHENLRKSQPEDEVRKIAPIRTLTVLNRLDGQRKGSVLQFLNDSELINGDAPIIILSKANLSGADLRQAFLGYVPQGEDQEYIEGANLRNVNLSEADLSRADLDRVTLRYANLTRANLSSASLEGADLLRANLTDADLSYTDLREAQLRHAVLTGANLTNTKLNMDAELFGKKFGADLSKADLKGVTGITVEELEKQVLLTGATMPDGSKHP